MITLAMDVWSTIHDHLCNGYTTGGGFAIQVILSCTSTTHSGLLDILAEGNSDLPPNFRTLIMARPEPAISGMKPAYLLSANI